MGRDELVELLARVRCGCSHAELRDEVPRLHEALAGIRRKKSHFLEDSCAAVLKQSFATVVRGSRTESGDEEEGEGELEAVLAQSVSGPRDSIGAVEACATCRTFVEPLILELPSRRADEDADLYRQRAVLIAFLLHLLGRRELSSDATHEESQKVAALVPLCGIDLDAILWTLRLREELKSFERLMTPRKMSTEDSDNEDDTANNDGSVDADTDSGDDGDDNDEAWMLRHIAERFGFDRVLDYFLKERGQEYGFASWSSIGIVRLVTFVEFTPPCLVSPYSRLFAMGAVVQVLLQSDTMMTKRAGLDILKATLSRCAPGGMAADQTTGVEGDGKHRSFARLATGIEDRDWLSPLIELVSNTMVSVPEAADRALALSVFRQLLQVVDMNHRLWLIKCLALRCPYGNVAAILVDQLRTDTFLAWSNLQSSPKDSPFTSSPLANLVVEVLNILCERDLKMHADFLVSVASLVRFIIIRDKENCVGLHSPKVKGDVKLCFERLHSRLRSTLVEVQSSATHPPHNNLGHKHQMHDETTRLFLVESALESTLCLL